MKLYLLSIVGAATLLIVVSTVSLTGTGSLQAAASPPDAAPVYVDSIIPIEEEIRRFQAAIGAPVSALTGGAESRDRLVARFTEAVQAADRAALESLVLNVEEFAYLYYPHTKYTSKPYEMAPGLLWFQLDAYGERGVDRAIARFRSVDLAAGGYRCPEPAEPLGEGMVWGGCVVGVPDAAGGVVETTLFGEILELGGSFKFVSYGNGL